MSRSVRASASSRGVRGRRASEGLSKENCVKGNHPELVMTNVRCIACGNEFTTRSTRAAIVLDVCSSCHPAYTGVERELVRGSRIDRFERRRARAATV
jgi:large subunit ribosomal protein L31